MILFAAVIKPYIVSIEPVVNSNVKKSHAEGKQRDFKNQELKLIQKINIFKSSQEKYDFLFFFLIKPKKKRLIDLKERQ